MANISAYAKRRPYMLSPGNHEAPCAYGEYEARAAMMPHGGSNSSDVQYYSCVRSLAARYFATSAFSSFYLLADYSLLYSFYFPHSTH